MICTYACIVKPFQREHGACSEDSYFHLFIAKTYFFKIYNLHQLKSQEIL